MKPRTLLGTCLLMAMLLANVHPSPTFGQSESGTGSQSIYIPLIYANYDPYSYPSNLRLINLIGPWGGTVTSLAIQPGNADVLYAGSWGGGVFRSADRGVTWTPLNNGLANRYLYSLAIDPQTPTTLYAGTYGDGVFKSVDGGLSWQPTGGGLNPKPVVYALAIDPQTPTTLYAGTRSLNPPDAANNRWGGGVFRSMDAGASWAPIMRGVTEDWVYGLAVDPQSPWIVYAATHTHGVFKTTDRGDSWYVKNDGLSDLSTRSLLIDPATPATLYVSTWHNGGIFRSDDGGNDWYKATAGLYYPKVLAMAMDPNDHKVLYAGTWGGGVFKTINSGKEWYPVDGPTTDPVYNNLISANIYALAADPLTSGALYAGASATGVYRTTNGGGNWVAGDQGLVASQVSTTALSPISGRPSILFAGTQGDGLYRSTAGGGSGWTASSAGIPSLWVNRITPDPGAPATLYTGTDDRGIYKTTNRGESWSAANIIAGSLSVPVPGSAPPPPPFTGKYDAPFFETNAFGDLGLETSSITDIAVHPEASQLVFTGTHSGVYKSTDGGGSWLAGGLAGRWIYALSFDPASGALFAATDLGIYKSLDNAASWGPVGFNSQPVFSISLPRGGPIFAGVAAGPTGGSATPPGLYQSPDGGATWFSRNPEIGPVSVTALAYDPLRPERVYAATSGCARNALFRSADGGLSFKSVDLGIANTDIYSLAVDPADPDVVYAGTYGAGVYAVRFLSKPLTPAAYLPLAVKLER